MQHPTDTDHHFDTDNRAWRRYVDVLGEHFEVVAWTNDEGRPVLTTVVDLGSGDAFTVAILDSIEKREPHTLLAFATGAELAAYGPFDGEPAATNYAPQLAMADPRVVATRAVPLHHPDQPTLPDDGWIPVPAGIARAARPAPTDAPATALVLLDRDRGLLAAVGPFPDHATAYAWQSTPECGPQVDRLVVPLHPVKDDA